MGKNICNLLNKYLDDCSLDKKICLTIYMCLLVNNKLYLFNLIMLLLFLFKYFSVLTANQGERPHEKPTLLTVDLFPVPLSEFVMFNPFSLWYK